MSKPTFCADNSDSLSFFFIICESLCDKLLWNSCPLSPHRKWQPFGRSWWSLAMELVGKHVFSLFSAKTSFLKSTSQRCSRTTSLTLRWTQSRFVLLTTETWCNNRKATLTVGGGLTLEFPRLSLCISVDNTSRHIMRCFETVIFFFFFSDWGRLRLLIFRRLFW